MLWKSWPIIWTTVTSGELQDSSADVIIVLVDTSVKDGSIAILHPALDEAVRDLVGRGAFSGKPAETALLPTLGLLPQKYALFVGCDAAPFTSKALRNAAGSIGNKLLELKIKAADVIVPAGLSMSMVERELTVAASAFVEGLLLGLYRRDSLEESGRVQSVLAEVAFVIDEQKQIADWNQGVEHGRQVADAVCYARELTNKPSNLLTPAVLAEQAQSLSEYYGFDCRIYNEEEAAKEGMGGLLAVGRGSANPPRMIVMRYMGAPDSKEILGLVGKGITFDAGGISIKPGQGMEEFISDMGGAAAVFGVMRGAGSLKPPINIVAVIAAAENMPSGSAYKPGDVITTYSGRTIEVINTDAEGRIVLADGMTTAIRFGATQLVDIATLTGAVMHALGDLTTGAFTNEDAFLQSLIQAGNRAGEYVWPLPLHPEYRSLIKSEVADMKNHGGPWAGAIAGALLIGAFSEERPWIHLDIGGTTWMWSDRGFESKGGTGVMVRTLLEYIRYETEHRRKT